MRSITMGTTNQAKIAQIGGALSLIGVEVNGVSDKRLLPQVVEDGLTAQENARKKAVAYAQALWTTPCILRGCHKKISQAFMCGVFTVKSVRLILNW